MKLNKLAVFLRGHPRTWHYTKQSIFEFCDPLAYQVDYFVALWKSNNVNYESIKDDFKDKNLKSWNILDNHKFYDSWTGPAYQSLFLQKFKFKEELATDTRYDMVLDTRTDLVFRLNSTPVWPGANEVGSTRVEAVPFVTGNFQYQGLEDHTFLMQSTEHVIWNQRGDYNLSMEKIKPLLTSSHSKLWYYAMAYNLTPVQQNWFSSNILRPNVISDRDTDKDLFSDSYKINELWTNYNFEQRAEFLKASNIGADQYDGALRFK